MLGRDPEHLLREARPQLRATGIEDLHLASPLDAPHTPRADRNDLVDDECDLGVPEDVAVFLASGEVVATDVDGVVDLVIAEARRDDVRRPIGTDGRQPPESDPRLQVLA